MGTTYRGQILTESARLVIEDCCSCHCFFAIPESMYDRARQDTSVWFYCPNGHRQHFTDTEIMQLRRKLRSEESRRVSAEDQASAARAEAEHQAARARGYKGAMVQTKKRVAKGVCPVPGCRRHFADVQRHIQSKHPSWGGTD